MGNWQQQQAGAFTIQALITWNVLAREDDPQFHKYTSTSPFLLRVKKVISAPQNTVTVVIFRLLQERNFLNLIWYSAFQRFFPSKKFLVYFDSLVVSLHNCPDYKAENGKANKQRLNKAAAKLGL